MKDRILALALLLTAGWPITGSAGEITGRITITKSLTKERVVVDSYQPRGAFVAAQAPRENRKEELSRVAIYLEGENLPLGSRSPPNSHRKNGSSRRRFWSFRPARP